MKLTQMVLYEKDIYNALSCNVIVYFANLMLNVNNRWGLTSRAN